MPKGVEHLKAHLDGGAESNVRTSVMPKGVEHATKNELEAFAGRENLCDAERR